MEHSGYTDSELVLLYKERQDQRHFGLLYQRYAHLVYGVCLKYLKNEDLAKDAVMDIFESLPNLLLRHEVKNFKSWLYSVGKNHCLMQLRKEKGIFEINSEEKINNLVMESEEESHLLNEKEVQLQQMEQGIESLNEEQRVCIRLFYLKQKSYHEVVEETGYDLKKVKSYIQNGKRNLKLYLTNNKTLIVLIILLNSIYVVINHLNS